MCVSLGCDYSTLRLPIQEYSGNLKSKQCPMMPWLLMSPGHRQTRYLLYRISRSLRHQIISSEEGFRFQWGRMWISCAISMLNYRWHKCIWRSYIRKSQTISLEVFDYTIIYVFLESGYQWLFGVISLISRDWCYLGGNQYRYSDAIMNAMTSQIPGVLIVCSMVCSGAEQRKY